MSKELTSRAEDYSQWYNELVIKGSLADYSAVRGCMVLSHTALPFGKICVISWTGCLKTQVTRMPIFPLCSEKFI
jgi:hypothetical protein